jgi:tetratricopeptide (TPR) repeat protein
MPKQKSQHVDDAKKVGERLRGARTRAGLSQRALSFSGCTPAYISRVEAGERIPSLQVLRVLGDKLGVSADYLATGQEVDVQVPELVEAEVAMRLDDFELAEKLFKRVLDRATRRQDAANAHAGLGYIAFRRDDMPRAIEEFVEALGKFGNARYEFPAVADALGRAYATAGQYEEAIAIFEEWLAALKKAGDEENIGRFEVLLANALIDTGGYGRASELLGSAIARAAKWADPLTRAKMYWSQSRLHAVQKNTTLAAQYARRALEILELTELTSYTARAHQLLAFIELERGEPTEALILLREGRAILGEGAEKLEVAKFKLEEARALAAIGEHEEAASLAMETMAVLSEANPPDAGRAYQTLAGVFVAMGDQARGKELYEMAIESLEAHGAPYVVEAYTALADLLKAEGKTAEALEVLEKAVAARAASPSPSPT